MKFFSAAAIVVLAVASPVFGQTADPRIAEALTPLPQDLKAGATVYTYDKTTGERQVLRKGTNDIECQPKGEDGFTWCYNKVTGPRRDLTAKLRAQKKSDKEVADAVAAAVKDGTIKTPPYGTMMYRYTDDPQRIKLLWVMTVPNATPESIGVSTASQRDAALKGHGMPWLMNAGTPGAHVMIPINATPLSNTSK